MTRRTSCGVAHDAVLKSPDLSTWLSWQRLSIEDFVGGKSFEIRRCPACGKELKRPVFVASVVYPVELPMWRSTPNGSPALDWPSDFLEFGTVLKHRRRAARLSRGQLAALAGVSESTVRNIETGRHRPRESQIDRLMAVQVLRGVIARERADLALKPKLRVDVEPADAEQQSATVNPRKKVDQ